jgi:hypothetical protein
MLSILEIVPYQFPVQDFSLLSVAAFSAQSSVAIVFLSSDQHGRVLPIQM